MLLPRGQRENEAAPPVPVLRLSHEASGQAPHVLFPAREHAQGRPPERAGDAQALPLSGDDVGALASRTLQEPEGQRLGEAGNQQRAAGMGPVRRCLHVFDAAEEVRRLHGDGGQIPDLLQAGEIGESRFETGDFQEFIAGGGEVGPDDLPVVGVDRPGEGRLFPLR